MRVVENFDGDVSQGMAGDDTILCYAPVDALQLMEFEERRSKAGTSPLRWMARFFSFAQIAARDCQTSLDLMLSHQTEALTMPLLKTSSDAQWHDSALSLFDKLLAVMEQPSLLLNDTLKLIHALLQQGLESEELKHELYVQIFKQTRNNVNDFSRTRGWRLLYIVSMTLSPSTEFSSLLVHYALAVSRDGKELQAVQELGGKTRMALKRKVRSGSRRIPPSMVEIDVHLSERPLLKTVVYFLDGTIEELPYEIGTTVIEAVKLLAATIGLINSESFSLFESHALDHPKVGWHHVLLHDHSYIADILQSFQQKTSSGKRHRLVFKKVTFRESDAYVVESQFINLSYLQAQHDFLNGHYPVGNQEAARLCALQLFSDYGAELPAARSALMKAIEHFTSTDVHLTGTKEEWKEKVVGCYEELQCETDIEARSGFLNILRSIPYGMAIFFKMTRLTDPLGILPLCVVLGINKNGLHFLRRMPKEYISSVEFRDVVHVGFDNRAVAFKLCLGGKIMEFRFESKDGNAICIAMRTHLNEAAQRIREYERDEGPLMSVNFGPGCDAYISQLHGEIAEAEKRQREMLARQGESVQELTDRRTEVESALQSAVDAKKRRCHAEDTVSEMSLEVLALKTHLRSLAKQNGRENHSSRKDVFHGLLQKEADLRQQLKNVTDHKLVLEQELRSFDEQSRMEIRSLEERIEASTSTSRDTLHSKRMCIASLVEKIANTNAMTNADVQEMEKYQQAKREYAELKELQKRVKSQENVFSQTIEEQRFRIDRLEQRCKEEQLSRKHIFNRVQDMKGNIRVYARVRPLLDLERKKGQSYALSFPDAVSITHTWKRDCSLKEYTFDGVFQSEATQTDVFKETEDLIQSAIDGYNACIFAYGQTGSGKTFTINGDRENPGLAPLGIHRLFDSIKSCSDKSSFVVKCYMVELYKDTLTDLLGNKKAKTTPSGRRYSDVSSVLSPRKSTPPLSEAGSRRVSGFSAVKERLEIKRENGPGSIVRVQGTAMVQVHSAEELLMTFERGQRQRHVASTQMNIQSSRSHLIMSIVIEATDLQTMTLTTGKLSFVDLAGSERLKKSGSTGEQLKEATAINKSLSALGDVISSLSRGDPHTPYRNHKLTLLMSDSIGGNSKTLMLVNVSPADGNIDETQNSLQYASRVRTIKNTALKNSSNTHSVLKKNLQFWRHCESADRKQRIERILAEFI